MDLSLEVVVGIIKRFQFQFPPRVFSVPSMVHCVPFPGNKPEVVGTTTSDVWGMYYIRCSNYAHHHHRFHGWALVLRQRKGGEVFVFPRLVLLTTESPRPPPSLTSSLSLARRSPLLIPNAQLNRNRIQY